MQKINPFTLPRPEALSETRIFTDPLQPGVELELTFKSQADYSEPLKVRNLAQTLIKERSGASAIPIQAGGRDIEIVDTLCVVIATILTLEVPQEWGRYSFEDWAAFNATMPNAFAEIVEWANEVMAKASGKQSADGTTQAPLE